MHSQKKCNRIIMALGSNYKASSNIARAKLLLKDRIDYNITFTDVLLTEPVGIVSDKFLNCLALAHTMLSQAKTIDVLKQIEAECGNTSELRTHNKVIIDIDLIMFNSTKLHDNDWKRDYISALIKQFRLN